MYAQVHAINYTSNSTQDGTFPFSVQAVLVEGGCRPVSYAATPNKASTRLFNV